MAQVRGERAESGDGAAEGFVYESPLIEQGSVILGGTKQDFGFALRQQYFHKVLLRRLLRCLMLRRLLPRRLLPRRLLLRRPLRSLMLLRRLLRRASA